MKHYIEKHVIANFTRFTLIYKHHCVAHFLIKVCSKSKVTKNIFNLQEWYQITRNYKSLCQQIFIVYKTFTVAIKTKNLPRTTRFGLWSFYKGVLYNNHLLKTTTFEWSQEWSPYTGLIV